MNNPYGNAVHERGEDDVTRKATCGCCGLPFAYSSPRRSRVVPRHCVGCSHHIPDGDKSQADQYQRTFEHHTKAVEMVDLWIEANHRLADELDETKRKLTAAYRYRDQADQVAAAALKSHDEKADGRCGCGKRYPCPTVAAVAEIGPSYLRKLQRRNESEIEWEDYARDNVIREKREPESGLA